MTVAARTLGAYHAGDGEGKSEACCPGRQAPHGAPEETRSFATGLRQAARHSTRNAPQLGAGPDVARQHRLALHRPVSLRKLKNPCRGIDSPATPLIRYWRTVRYQRIAMQCVSLFCGRTPKSSHLNPGRYHRVGLKRLPFFDVVLVEVSREHGPYIRPCRHCNGKPRRTAVVVQTGRVEGVLNPGSAHPGNQGPLNPHPVPHGR